MDKVILVLGVAVLLIGIAYLLKPDVVRWLLRFFRQGKRIYFVGLIRFALAIVFLLAARECDITWAIAAFGILFLISGLLIFVLGLEKVKSILEWWEGKSVLTLRLLALVTVAIGAAIIFSA